MERPQEPFRLERDFTATREDGAECMMAKEWSVLTGSIDG